MATNRWDRIRVEAVRDKERLLAKYSDDALDRIAYRAELFGGDDGSTHTAIDDARTSAPKPTWAQIAAALGLGSDQGRLALHRHAYWRKQRGKK
jgi:hypothetical protein